MAAENTTSQPLFSICIPCYNHGNYVGKTIESVLSQTFGDYEIVVADNASTDNSRDVVRSFKDPRIRLVENRYNIGFAPNLQQVTRQARGRFINLLSSDDLMKPNALESFAAALRGQREDWDRVVLFSDHDLIDGEGKLTGQVKFNRDSLSLDWRDGTINGATLGNGPGVYNGWDILRRSLPHLRICAPFLTLVYPRALWESVEGYNGIRNLCPDKHFAYKLFGLNPVVVHVPQALYQYRFYWSANQKAVMASVKQPIDDYFAILETSNQLLSDLGVRREDMIREFLDRICFRFGLLAMATGTYQSAFSRMAFALATFPVQAIGRPRFYALGGLLALGPLGKLLASTIYKGWRNIAKRKSLKSSHGHET